MRSYRAIEVACILLFLGLTAALTVSSRLSPAAAPSLPDPSIDAHAFAMPDDGWAPLDVVFSPYGSRAGGRSLTRYEWDMDGDGQFETDASASDGYTRYTFVRPGLHVVTLRVSDAEGQFATATTTVEVRHPGSSSVDYWTVFDDSRVRRIDLIVTQANWDAMWAVPESKTEVEADAVIFGERIEHIGLSMKGNGSLDASHDKKSWKLDMNAFVEGQEFHNLAMLLLHNNFADPSLLREKMAYDMAQFAGVPSAFTAYVEVWVDISDDDQPPEYLGIYTLVERPDRKYVANRFGQGNDGGNLFKADAWFEQGAADLAYYGPDISSYPMPRGRVAYRLMTNQDEADYSDVINLCYTIDGVQYATPDDFATAVEQVLDVDTYLRYLAVIFVSLNLDTYPYTGNNFYLYDNPGTGLFEFVAWDMNNSWGHFAGGYDFPLYGVPESLGPLQFAPLFVKAFEVDRYRLAYRAYVDLLIRYWFNGAVAGEQAHAWHDLLAPYLTQSTGDRDFIGQNALYSLESFDSGWQEIASMTQARAEFLHTALAEAELEEGSP